MTIKVGVIGAGGRMGATTCAAIEGTDDLELVARIGRGDELARLTDVGAEVAVDFTHRDSVLGTVETCVAAGIHVVVGTSGLGKPDLDAVRAMLDGAPAVGVVVAPNFSVGAVLMMQMAAQAAPHFTSVEIVELHRDTKPDVPSGTAMRTAEMVAAARSDAGVAPSPDATSHGRLEARGADVDGVRVHAVRLRGLLAHQEVLLGSDGEVLTIRHDSLDRSSFMPGVLLAVRSVRSRPGLTVGLEHLLDLSPPAAG
ncbi:MAG: 4-hydroxy-tetrahydrodipicolinate reductase [Actinomycetota bacterium]|nr:4-hydroxy-tetrahydrodipicolinate reductase [Sporichthyaceae bacterium]MDQ3112843.1 4-hydroxy-tetrahydrodipicolinate reductase [Actinomycetota bacterium]